MMNFSAQTNAVCGNASCLRQWGGVGIIWTINDDNSQTPCLRLKAAWLLASRYIHIKKYTLSFIYKFLSPTRVKDPRIRPPSFVCVNQKQGKNRRPNYHNACMQKNDEKRGSYAKNA